MPFLINPYRFGTAASGLLASMEAFSITLGSGVATNTATISSVDTSRSFIIWDGANINANVNADSSFGYLQLTNSTTVTATRNSTSNDLILKGTVVQMNPGVIQSIQRGVITLTAATSNTASITSVTTTNSFCSFLGFSTNNASKNPNRSFTSVELTNATTVTAAKNNATGNTTVSYEVVEFGSGVLNSSTQQLSLADGSNTVTQVATARSVVIYGGYSTSATNQSDGWAYTRLRDSTTVQVQRQGTATFAVKGTLIEFKAADFVSVDRDVPIDFASGSAVATISAVDTSRTYVSNLSRTANTSNFDVQNTVVLTNSTTVTGTANNTTETNPMSFEAVQFGTVAPTSIIASIQTVSIALGNGVTSNTATISSVNTGRSFVVWGGQTSNNGANVTGNSSMCDITLTNSTTVTATRSASDTNTHTVKGTVIEFAAGVIQSIQQGTITMAGVASNTATISSVTTANAFVHYNGQIFTPAATAIGRNLCRLSLTNSTTVTASRGSATGSSAIARYVVVEFASGILKQATAEVAITLASTVSSANDTTTIPGNANLYASMLFYNGHETTNTVQGNSSSWAYIRRVSDNTVNATRGGTTNAVTIGATYVEFKQKDIANVTSAQPALSGVTSNTATIPTANTAKTFVSHLGMSTTDTSNTENKWWTTAVLTNSTTATAAANTAPTADTVSLEVVEFN